MKPQEKKKFELDAETKRKIAECPFEPTLFKCGLATCRWLHGEDKALQKCKPKNRELTK